jgi:hypothetical protein
MTLPPLPLVDNCLFFDNSAFELLQVCPSAYEKNRLWRRMAVGDSAALSFGTAVHSALEYRYTTLKNASPTIISEEEQVGVLAKHFAEHPVSDDEHRSLGLATEIIQRYNQRYHLEPFNVLEDKDGKVLCELSFALPLCQYRLDAKECVYWNGKKESLYIPANDIGIIITGRIDLPIHWDGQIMIVDHKTSSMFFGPQRFLDEERPSNQYRIYCWAFEKLTSQKVGGFVINGVRTKSPPVKPKNGLDQWWAEGFVRDVNYLALTPDWQTETVNAMVSLVERFFWHYEKGVFPMAGKFTKACSRYGGCQYGDVCTLGSDEKRHEMLMSPVFKDNEWSPLKSVEENKQKT